MYKRQAEVGPGGGGDEGGLVGGGEAGAGAGGFGLGDAPGAAYVAEGAEGGGVGAGLAGEVAAEAEHVSPLPELEFGELRQVAEVPGGADHLPYVLLDGQGLDGFGLSGAMAVGAAVWQAGRSAYVAAPGARAAHQRAVHGPRTFSVLRGVLGDVSGDLGVCVLGDPGVGEFAVAQGGDGVHLEPAAPGDDAFADGVGLDDEPGAPDGQAHGGAQGVEGGPGRGRGGVAVGPVEADHGVEVDQAALLVLGDLGEGDAQGGVQRLLRHAEVFGQGAAQVGGEACPELSGVGVPEHGARVVVRDRVQWRAEFRGVFAVRLAASAGAGLARVGGGAIVDGAEGGGGDGDEGAGVVADGFGDVLAAGQPGLDQVVGVGGVDAGAGGAAGGAAVAAGGQQASGGFVFGAVGADHFLGGLVGGDRPAVEVDRVGAAAQVADLLLYAVEVVGVGQFDQVPQAGADDVPQVEGAAHGWRGLLSGARVGPAGSSEQCARAAARRHDGLGPGAGEDGGCREAGGGARLYREAWSAVAMGRPMPSRLLSWAAVMGSPFSAW